MRKLSNLFLIEPLGVRTKQQQKQNEVHNLKFFKMKYHVGFIFSSSTTKLEKKKNWLSLEK